MRDIDDDTLAEVLVDSHTVRCEVTCYYGGAPSVGFALPVAGGSITWDAGQVVTGSLSAAFARYATDSLSGQVLDLLPTEETSPLGANGQRLAVRYYVGGHGDNQIAVDLGWFRIDSWDEDEEAGTITVAASSLESVLLDARFLYGKTIAAGTSFAAAAVAIVEGLLPLTVSADPARLVATRLYELDRLEALSDLVKSWPARMVMDDSGVLAIVDPPDGTEPVVLTLTDGQDGTVVQAPRQGSREAMYNAVRASGESDGTTAPVAAIAYIATGPRRYGGPFGRVPYFYASPLLTTAAQCAAAAKTRLAVLQRRALPVAVQASPDPRLQIGDLIALIHAGRSLTLEVDAITLPLTADGGPMTVTGHELGTQIVEASA